MNDQQVFPTVDNAWKPNMPLNVLNVNVPAPTQDSLIPSVNEIQCPENLPLDGMFAIKRTYQPSVLRRKRKHGFLKRLRTVSGRRTLKDRKQKKRSRLSA